MAMLMVEVAMPAEDAPLDSENLGDDDYVPAFFARNITEADEYCELLSDHEIPARAGLGEELLVEADPEHRAASRRGMTHGVPVLVPESLLDEASEVIADREDLSNFEIDDEADDDCDDDEEPFGLGQVDDALLDDDDDDDEADGDELLFDDDDDDDDEEEDENY